MVHLIVLSNERRRLLIISINLTYVFFSLSLFERIHRQMNTIFLIYLLFFILLNSKKFEKKHVNFKLKIYSAYDDDELFIYTFLENSVYCSHHPTIVFNFGVKIDFDWLQERSFSRPRPWRERERVIFIFKGTFKYF